MTTYNPTIPDDVPLAQVMQQQQQQRSRESSGDPLSSSTFSNLASPTASTFVPERANSMLSTVSHGTTRTATGGPDPFQHATTPGLRATITETVNVLSKGGEVNRVMVTGEIALSHRIDPSSSAGRDGLRIRIARFQEFEKAAPNSAYISPIADAPGEYTILPSLHSSGHTSTVLKYQLHIAEGTEASYVPLNVKALWQCQEGQTRVIINYSTNAQARIAEKAEASPFGGDEDEEMAPELEELSFAVPVSAPVTTFQAKPAAVWAAEKARLTFNLEPLAVRAGVEGKVLAAVSTEGTAVAQPVAVRWKVVGRSVSRVGVEVVGEAAEQVEEVRRSTVSGKYLVAP